MPIIVTFVGYPHKRWCEMVKNLCGGVRHQPLVCRGMAT